MYKTEDYGLFLGFMTMPFGEEENFIKYDIETQFAQYKENVVENLSGKSSDAPTFSSYLYSPRTYYLFGNFDLAVFSLVDDFSLSTRNFHPFSPLIYEKHEADKQSGKTKYEPNNYAYHVISAVAPDLRYIDSKEDSLLDRARKTFLKKDRAELPLIAITSLKLNNAFLIGGGGDFIDLTLRKIRSILADTESNYEGRLQYFILHSFSWHEITVVLFSDSYNKIADKILKIRQLTFGGLENSQVPELNKIYENVLKVCLLSKMWKKENGKSKQSAMRQKCQFSHLFVNTHTTFGYDPQILSGDIQLKKELNQGFRFYTRWDIKPGHLSSFKKDLTECLKTIGKEHLLEGARITAGRGDYAYVTGQNGLQELAEVIGALVSRPLMKHVRKIFTIPEFSEMFDLEDQHSFDVKDHYFFHESLQKFRFNLEEIRRVRSQLKQLRVSKTLREKITNMFVNYNYGIHDPVLYGYFIELRPYLTTVLEILEIQVAELNSVIEITHQLTSMADRFEIGYKNRFGQSYIMNEITDFNIDFNGGIQQMVTAYDGAYKSLTALLGEGAPGRSIAYVAGHSNIESDMLSVCLNYFHLYQPEFFAAAATHEAANHFFFRYSVDSENPQLLDQLKLLKSDLAIKCNLDKTEKKILDYFFIDLAAFHLAYNRDFQLFFYWHWCSFLQTGINYNTDGRIYQAIFDRFLFRMLLLAKFTNNMEVFDEKILPPFGSHSRVVIRAWELTMTKAKNFLDRFYTSGSEFHTYYQMAQQNVFGIIYDEFLDVSGLKKKKKKAIHDLLMEQGEPAALIRQRLENDDHPPFQLGQGKTLSDKDRESLTIYLAREEWMKHIAKQIIAAFEKGELFDFSEIKQQKIFKRARTSFFYHALFLAYLTLIRNLSKDQAKVLKRDISSGKVKQGAVAEEEINLQFDPTGGIFTANLAMREKYFKYRVLFLKSLWMLSMKNKVELFLE